MGPLKSSLNWSNFSDLPLWAILYHSLPWSYYYLTHFVAMTFSFNKSWFKKQLVQCNFKNGSADLLCYYLNTILFIWTLEGDYLSTSVYCLSIYRFGWWNIHSYIILKESQSSAPLGILSVLDYIQSKWDCKWSNLIRKVKKRHLKAIRIEHSFLEFQILSRV